MAVTKTRSTKRSRARHRKLMLSVLGLGFLLVGFSFWLTAQLQEISLQGTGRLEMLNQFAVGSASAGLACLILRHALIFLESRRRARRRKRYESYREAYDSNISLDIPEDWEE